MTLFGSTTGSQTCLMQRLWQTSGTCSKPNKPNWPIEKLSIEFAIAFNE